MGLNLPGLKTKLAKVAALGALGILVCAYQNCAPAFKVGTLNSSTGASVVPTHKVSVFMASGHMGRTVYSCDDGKTWIGDRSHDDNARCWRTGDPNYVECDHTPYSGHGIDSGDGLFFTNFGWGADGSIQMSSDGRNWKTLKSDGWGGGVAYADQTLYLGWNGGWRSADLGKTWTADPARTMGLFDHATVSRVNDKFVIIGRGDGIAISTNQGLTWNHTPTFPVASGQYIAEGNGILVTVGASGSTPAVGKASRSTDNGATWETNDVFSQNYLSFNGLLFNGSEFVAFSPGLIWKSADGRTWTRTNVVIPNFNMGLFSGPVSYNKDTGTYVRITAAWDNYYEKQFALRSTDGVNWTVLDTAHFKGGHPMSTMTLGTMDSSACAGN